LYRRERGNYAEQKDTAIYSGKQGHGKPGITQESRNAGKQSQPEQAPFRNSLFPAFLIDLFRIS
jgi:hypothetical protein